MSNRDLRTQSYGGDVALDCWVCGKGQEGWSPRGSQPWRHRREMRLPARWVVMLTAAR